MTLGKKINLPMFTDTRGALVAVEAHEQVPFSFERAYIIFGNKNDKARGFHAHRELEQLLICVAGSCNIVLDNAEKREKYKLDRPEIGLLIGKMIWREIIDFTSDCVLLSLASKPFDVDDYISDYKEYAEEQKNIFQKIASQ